MRGISSLLEKPRAVHSLLGKRRHCFQHPNVAQESLMEDYIPKSLNPLLSHAGCRPRSRFLVSESLLPLANATAAGKKGQSKMVSHSFSIS